MAVARLTVQLALAEQLPIWRAWESERTARAAMEKQDAKSVMSANYAWASMELWLASHAVASPQVLQELMLGGKESLHRALAGDLHGPDRLNAALLLAGWESFTRRRKPDCDEAEGLTRSGNPHRPDKRTAPLSRMVRGRYAALGRRVLDAQIHNKSTQCLPTMRELCFPDPEAWYTALRNMTALLLLEFMGYAVYPASPRESGSLYGGGNSKGGPMQSHQLYVVRQGDPERKVALRVRRSSPSLWDEPPDGVTVLDWSSILHGDSSDTMDSGDALASCRAPSTSALDRLIDNAYGKDERREVQDVTAAYILRQLVRLHRFGDEALSDVGRADIKTLGQAICHAAGLPAPQPVS